MRNNTFHSPFLLLAVMDSIKGTKKLLHKSETRYKESSPPVILNGLPQGWKPECSILEGMFIINTIPLGTHRTLADYAQFLIRGFILPQFSKGSRLFLTVWEGCNRPPNIFERLRHDAIAPVATGHTCDEFHSHIIIPSKCTKLPLMQTQLGNKSGS